MFGRWHWLQSVRLSWLLDRLECRILESPRSRIYSVAVSMNQIQPPSQISFQPPTLLRCPDLGPTENSHYSALSRLRTHRKLSLFRSHESTNTGTWTTAPRVLVAINADTQIDVMKTWPFYILSTKGPSKASLHLIPLPVLLTICSIEVWVWYLIVLSIAVVSA